jgi:hypothetical protein
LRGEGGVRGSLHEFDPWVVPLTRSLRDEQPET